MMLLSSIQSRSAAPGGVHQPAGPSALFVRPRGENENARRGCGSVELLCAYRSIRRGSTERAHGAVGKKLPAGPGTQRRPRRKHQSARHCNICVLCSIAAANNQLTHVANWPRAGRSAVSSERGPMRERRPGLLWLEGYGFFFHVSDRLRWQKIQKRLRCSLVAFANYGVAVMTPTADFSSSFEHRRCSSHANCAPWIMRAAWFAQAKLFIKRSRIF